jgi:hypothetical protein
MGNLTAAEREFFRIGPYEKSVFIMMRFRADDVYTRIRELIKGVLEAYGFVPRYADDRSMAPSLWESLRFYMDHCMYGIAVFEQIDERQYDPNVSLEFGYMLGLDKKCLVLKESRAPTLHSDIAGFLYKTFDAFRIEHSIPVAIEEWMRDLGISSAQARLRERLRNLVVSAEHNRQSKDQLNILWCLDAKPQGLEKREVQKVCFPTGTPSRDRFWRALQAVVDSGFVRYEALPGGDLCRLVSDVREALREITGQGGNGTPTST